MCTDITEYITYTQYTIFTRFTRTCSSRASTHMQDVQRMLVCCQSSPAKKVCQEKTQVVYLYYCVYRVYRVSNKGMLDVRIIALANQKGGVGKTTSTINIGTGLTQFGRTVLLADLDPQAHLTYSLGIPAHELEATIYEVLRGKTTLEKVMLQKYGVTILPASLDLSGAEIELAAVPGREFLLREAMSTLQEFDYVLLDCPPSLGLLTLNALTTATEVYIPLQTEFLAL